MWSDYSHVFISGLVYHVPQFLNKYKFIHDLGVSQVERKNKDQKEAYFRATNWGGGKYGKKICYQVTSQYKQFENAYLFNNILSLSLSSAKTMLHMFFMLHSDT